MNRPPIIVRGARCHNLKGVDLSLSPNQLVVFTGVSGSGKSSLAFDTLFVEGQRRYVESLSHFARRHLGEMSKPDVDHISGMSPTISIEQKTAGRNPRSTVGTMTEVYDYLRVLYARVATPHCPVSGEKVSPQSKEQIIHEIQALPQGSKLIVLAPYAQSRKGAFKDDFQELLRKGYMRVRVDGEIHSLDAPIPLDGKVAHDVDVVVDRLVINEEAHSRIAESVTVALELGEGLCRILMPDTKEDERLYSLHGYSPASGLSYPPLEPHDFSFNSPLGMCPSCEGLGETLEYDLEKIINPELSIAEDCCSIASAYDTVRFGNIYRNLARIYRFDIETPWKDLPARARKAFLHGIEGKKWTRMYFVHPKTDARWQDYVNWRGVIHEARRRYAEAKSDHYRRHAEKLMLRQVCAKCNGGRLRPYPAATKLGGRSIVELCSLTLDKMLIFLDQLSLDQQQQLIAEELLKEIKERIQFLIDVGLHYLTLDRSSPTLSGGEAQRVRLASQIGCGLVGVTYILDEPSIGLHPRDNRKLIDTLLHLRDMGNSVVVVEHDEETMLAADRVVDFGPGPGVRGGEIVVDGTVSKLLKSRKSLTGAYLSGRKQIPIPEKRRQPSDAAITIRNATHHNLKGIDVSFPTGLFITVTGVSGSGKSSLVSDILYPALANSLHRAEHKVGTFQALEGVDHIDKVIAIDQSPIGRNPRSNPSTYIKLADEIRDLFAQLPESRARGYQPGRFSFNVKEGSCAVCGGMGMVKIDMDFLEDQWVDCTACNGRRFDNDTLSVHYRGKSIYDVLEMDVAEAADFFRNIPSISRKLAVLRSVGLEYIKLGQPSPTLSGGEAQRVKLSKQLVRPPTGRTLYILDEPTTGLHFYDIEHLLSVLHSLVEKGNSVVVIEHNVDVIKSADWIIDLGPEGGEGGGRIIGEGSPETIASLNSATGTYLKEALHPNRTTCNSKKKRETSNSRGISNIAVMDARQNNLKGVDLVVPHQKLTIFTGPSGSGKSSLAFDTIYAEGQRRYVESLSPYARQFVKQMAKPKVGEVEGLSPAIAIEQKAHAGNPRSTIGTMTEIYDYLRIAFARMGVPHCPETGEVIQAVSKESVVDTLLHYPLGTRLHLMAPLTLKRGEELAALLERYRRQGYLRIRLNGTFHQLDDDLTKIPIDRRRKNELCLVVDRVKVGPASRNRLYEAVELASSISGGVVVVQHDDQDALFNLTFSVPSTGKSYPEITPHTFSFNSPEGMCPDCQGLGFQYGAHLSENKNLLEASLHEFFALLWGDFFTDDVEEICARMFERRDIFLETPLCYLTTEQLQYVLNGAEEDDWNDEEGLQLRWIGINNALSKAGTAAHRSIKELVIPLLDEHACLSCGGARVNALARHVTLAGKSIGEVCATPIEELISFIDSLRTGPQESKVLQEVLDQLSSRLTFLNEVGLGYISLDRRAPTLSGGEAQRIRLARQLGTSLTGVLYVLDEPTIGLHPHDNARLNAALGKLKDLGNTIVMVEHDPLTIATADRIVDFGPGSGNEGGTIVAQGTFKAICRNPRSLSGRYLSGKRSIPIPSQRRTGTGGALTISNASIHNLKNLTVQFPIGVFSCVTGVSGSGKSSLIGDLLQPAVQRNLGAADEASLQGATVAGIDNFDRLISVDQSPVGRTARADVGTYSELLPPMRDFFAQLPTARTLGLRPGNFSFNHRKGMCTHCWGLGYKRIELHFLPPVRITCPECHGLRLNPVSLQVKYEGKNFGEHLQSTVEQACITFQHQPRMVRVLDTLIDVGLGYLQLGQRMQTLSGGEAQRIKLSRELAKRSRGHTLYLLDEPTTGLHSEDLRKLLKVLQLIVDQGNTMIVVEHNIDMIKSADYVIDLGPDAGAGGGEIVCCGTPEEIAQHPSSYTARYLKPALAGS